MEPPTITELPPPNDHAAFMEAWERICRKAIEAKKAASRKHTIIRPNAQKSPDALPSELEAGKNRRI